MDTYHAGRFTIHIVTPVFANIRVIAAVDLLCQGNLWRNVGSVGIRVVTNVDVMNKSELKAGLTSCFPREAVRDHLAS